MTFTAQETRVYNIATLAAKRKHGRAAFESLGYWLQAWTDETAAQPTAGVRLTEGRALYRKLSDLLKDQKII